MGAADPSYPLFPIASIIASLMLFLVLSTSFVRQSWNLGVVFLCFWLFLENVTGVANTIIWSDNADIKYYVYCDIVSHLQIITFVVKPMATLLIARRLYLIASFQSVELPSKAARRWDLAVEWNMGLTIPLLVGGPIYYALQGARFAVYEGSGCTTAEDITILELLIEESWSIVPPLISIVCYYPRAVRTYYRQRRGMDSFLRSNLSVSRMIYLRILALASIDILLTLPIGIVNITLDILTALSPPKFFPFYPGWTFVHADWEPVAFSYSQQQAGGIAPLAQSYFTHWTSPILAFAIFGLFGLTSEARASYWRIVRTVGGWFGWRPMPYARNDRTSLGEIEFGAPQQGVSTSGGDLEAGFISTDASALDRSAGSAYEGHTKSDMETELKSRERACHEKSLDDTDTQGTESCIPTIEDRRLLSLERCSAASGSTFKAGLHPNDAKCFSTNGRLLKHLIVNHMASIKV